MSSDSYLFKELMRTLIYIFKLISLLSFQFFFHGIKKFISVSLKNPADDSNSNKRFIILSMAFRNILLIFCF